MIILKWRKLVDSVDHPSFVSYSVIGKIFGIDGSSVRRLIIKRFNEMKKEKMMTRKKKKELETIPIKIRYGMRYLSAEHTAFLLSPDTLKNWIGFSLEERCLMFHRHFGNHRINPTLLRRFYHEHKIRKKKIKWVKHINPDKEAEYEEWRLNLKHELSDLRRDHYRIIFLDEAVFTTKTIRNVEYTANRDPLRVP